jgi:hypothetical protein
VEAQPPLHANYSELYPSKRALDEAIASGSSGTGAAGEQFTLLDEVLITLVGS